MVFGNIQERSAYADLSCAYAFIIFIIFREKCRRIQFIRAFALAPVTMQTVLDFFHLFLNLFGQLECGWGTAKQQGHACAVVNLDAGGAGHTIAAATAEVSA